ncbi:reverse transcriptase domain-containing protein, partial [Klebsiella pneumoniae]|uniref:reverse transcriptase domain-containing protein n=1 Tax=Klebsiella pneumoniae TaxID=573 RepID=UPI001059EE4B
QVPDAIIHLLKHYLCDRTFKVRVNNTYSNNKTITAGVQQGSILGPTLFNIFVNDIPRTDLTSLALYADDTVIYSSAPHRNSVSSYIQYHLNALESWFINWKIKINTNKCKAIYFSRTYKLPPRLYLHDEAIDWCDSVKYLGVTLDRRLTWKFHIKNVRNAMEYKLRDLRSLMYGHHLSIKNKLLLYKAVILPTVTYASPIWSFASQSQIGVLEGLHGKTLRRIAQAPRYLKNTIIRRDLCIDTLKNILVKLSSKFYNDIYSLPNPIIAELPDYDHRKAKHRKRPRAAV